MGGSLSGYRVLDLTDEKGMLCPRLLADMGAEVIRVERPGDISTRRSAEFCYLNLGKRSITLNIEAVQGREIFKRLVGNTDVVVESNLPGYLDALGLGYNELSEINRQLIMTSITGFGQDGPYRHYNWCDLVMSALGGQMYINGEPDTPPLKPFGSQTCYTASLFAAIGTVLAILARHTIGRGQHVDTSAMECTAATLDHVLVRYFYEGVVAKRQGSRHWNNAFQIFPCRNGYILLSLFQHWDTLVELLASEGMAEDLNDARWQSREERSKHLDHVIAVLEGWTRTHTVAELVEKGQLMSFPWAEVASIAGLVDSPQLAARDFFVEVDCPGLDRKVRCPGPPVKLSASPWQAGKKLQRIGESNADVFREELGLSEGEMEAMTRDGVI